MSDGGVFAIEVLDVFRHDGVGVHGLLPRHDANDGEAHEHIQHRENHDGKKHDSRNGAGRVFDFAANQAHVEIAAVIVHG